MNELETLARSSCPWLTASTLLKSAGHLWDAWEVQTAQIDTGIDEQLLYLHQIEAEKRLGDVDADALVDATSAAYREDPQRPDRVRQYRNEYALASLDHMIDRMGATQCVHALLPRNALTSVISDRAVRRCIVSSLVDVSDLPDPSPEHVAVALATSFARCRANQTTPPLPVSRLYQDNVSDVDFGRIPSRLWSASDIEVRCDNIAYRGTSRRLAVGSNSTRLFLALTVKARAEHGAFRRLARLVRQSGRAIFRIVSALQRIPDKERVIDLWPVLDIDTLDRYSEFITWCFDSFFETKDDGLGRRATIALHLFYEAERMRTLESRLVAMAGAIEALVCERRQPWNDRSRVRSVRDAGPDQNGIAARLARRVAGALGADRRSMDELAAIALKAYRRRHDVAHGRERTVMNRNLERSLEEVVARLLFSLFGWRQQIDGPIKRDAVEATLVEALDRCWDNGTPLVTSRWRAETDGGDLTRDRRTFPHYPGILMLYFSEDGDTGGP